jgi:hypothetical protein
MELALGPADALPTFEGAAIAAGHMMLAPTTIAFLTVPTAGNSVCRLTRFMGPTSER